MPQCSPSPRWASSATSPSASRCGPRWWSPRARWSFRRPGHLGRGFCSAWPIFMLVGVEHENGTDPRDTNECRATEFTVRSGLLTIMVWVSSIFFFLPVFCLTVLYSLIGRKLWRRRRSEVVVGASLRIEPQTNREDAGWVSARLELSSPRAFPSPWVSSLSCFLESCCPINLSIIRSSFGLQPSLWSLVSLSCVYFFVFHFFLSIYLCFPLSFLLPSSRHLTFSFGLFLCFHVVSRSWFFLLSFLYNVVRICLETSCQNWYLSLKNLLWSWSIKVDVRKASASIWR